MDNHYVIERIMKNLAFELQPGPLKEDSSDGDPLSVKIKIRNKQAKAAEPQMILKKVRLVNSDETLMSFDMLMEKDYHQVTPRKSRKNTGNFFDKLKPGLCTKQIDDNDYVYLPSSNNNYVDLETKDGNKPVEIRKQQVKLSEKDMNSSARTGTMKKEKTFLGTKCRAGGCLDPSFDEDRYSYGPNLKDFVDQDLKGQPKVKSGYLDTKSNETNKTNYKSKDKSFLIKPVDDDISVSKKESLQISLITYPTYDENNKQIRYGNNEDRPSITDSINVIFNPPKGFKRNSNNHLQQPSSKYKEDSIDDVFQKNKEYLRESELQNQQQKDSMTNAKLDLNTNINIETIGSSRTSYSSSEENNLHRTEVSANEQNGLKQGIISNKDSFSNCESGNGLSKELKAYNHSGSELNNQYSQPIKDIDTYAIKGKRKKEKHFFLGSKCKPGGCLDPSLDEDKYAYRPSTQILSKQRSNISTVKQKKSDVNITPEISSKRICDETDNTPTFIKPCDGNNVESYKLNEVESSRNSSIANASKNAFNMEEVEQTSLRYNSYENNLQYSNNNSINSFNMPCHDLEQDSNNYKQQNSCGLVVTKNDKVEQPESSMSLLSTFSSSMQNVSEANINNHILTPSKKMLLEQESVSQNIISEFLTSSERLNSNTDLNSILIEYTKTTDSVTSTTDTVIKKETADSIIHVGSINIPSEVNRNSSTIDNILENSDELYNHVLQNTTSNDDVILKTTKGSDDYSGTTTDFKINNDKSTLCSNICKTESLISTLEISDIECQAEGVSEGDVPLKNEKITLNQFQPSLNEPENSLISPPKEIEQNSNLLQTSPKYNSECAVKEKPTKTSLPLLNLSASSEQNFSISTIQSVYTNSNNDSPQSFHTVEIFEHKENVSLIKDFQQDATEYFLIADTTDIIDEIHGAEIVEDYIDHFEADQHNGSHIFNKTEEVVEDKNQLSSQLSTNQASINAKNVEYKKKDLPDSNETDIENKEADLSENTIRDDFAKSSYYNTINDNAANEIKNNNKSDSIVNESKKLQYPNQNAHKIRISKDDYDDKTAIRETELKICKNSALSSRTSLIDQKDFNGRRAQPRDNELLLIKDPIKYNSINKNNKCYTSDKKIIALDLEHPDFIESHHILPTADEKEFLANLHENKDNEQSEPTLVASEYSSPVKVNDTIILDFTFHSYMNKKNQRIIRTIKNEREVERYPNDSTFVLKSQLKSPHNKSKQKINIPLGSDVGMIINIENISGDECSKSAAESILASDQLNIQKAINKAEDGKIMTHCKTNARNQVNSTLTHIYEQDLMPLQTMIRNLKYEIEDLGKQQMLLKKQALCERQPNLQRNKSCNTKLDSKNGNFCTCRST